MEKTFGQTDEGNVDIQQPQDETSVAVASILESTDSPKAITKSEDNGKQKRNDDDLKRSAGEILNGVKRTVEVQVVNPDNTFNFQNQTILGKFRRLEFFLNIVFKCKWFCFFIRRFSRLFESGTKRSNCS